MTVPPTVSLAAGTTRVAFVRSGDRWGHRVDVAGADAAAAFAWESVEGDASGGDGRWPESPPLTEVSVVAAAGRAAILGVGRAGRSHFSVSITAHPTLADTLMVEAACRVQEPPGWLGSTYRSTPGGTPARIAAPPGDSGDLPRTVEWAYTIGPRGLVAGRSGGPAPPA